MENSGNDFCLFDMDDLTPTCTSNMYMCPNIISPSHDETKPQQQQQKTHNNKYRIKLVLDQVFKKQRNDVTTNDIIQESLEEMIGADENNADENKKIVDVQELNSDHVLLFQRNGYEMVPELR